MKKKLLISLLTTGLINNANAIDLYNNGEGFTYILEGDFQIQLRKDVEQALDLNIEFDDLELENRVNYQINQTTSAFGQLSVDYADAAEGKDEYGVELSEAYIGMAFNSMSITLGMQDYATDDFGIDEAYEMYTDSSAFDEQGTDGDDVIRFDITTPLIILSLSTELPSKGAESEGGKSFDVLASASYQGVELVTAYQTKAENIGDEMVESYGVSLAYDAGIATIAGDYSQIVKGNTIYNLATSFKAQDDFNLRLGYVGITSQNDEKSHEYYANITYQFPTQKNVRLFAEIEKTDNDVLELGYLAGIRLKF